MLDDNDGPEEDYDEILTRNLPPPGTAENISRSGTLTEKSDNELNSVDANHISNNQFGGNFKTKKPNQAKVPKMYVREEERKKLLAEQAATNEYHKFVEGNLIIKQGNHRILIYSCCNNMNIVSKTLGPSI